MYISTQVGHLLCDRLVSMISILWCCAEYLHCLYTAKQSLTCDHCTIAIPGWDDHTLQGQLSDLAPGRRVVY